MEESIQVDTRVEAVSGPASADASGQPERRRPRLNLTAALGGDRKRGKGMLGLVLGTLNKAKIEDKERNASDAAKKRQMIEKRLQMKLRKETDSVSRAEEAKKDKQLANRKEEELQLKDSIHKLRRKRLPRLANFLLTSDIIPSDSSNPLSGPTRSHPPPLYYLPAVLTPEQEAFLNKRKSEVKEAAEKEWQAFKAERAAGIEEINQLRQKVVDEEARAKAELEDMDMDAADEPSSAMKDASPSAPPVPEPPKPESAASYGGEMDVDDSAAKPSEPPKPVEKKEEVAPMQADDDDAVEY